jgi:hypothetical protein
MTADASHTLERTRHFESGKATSRSAGDGEASIELPSSAFIANSDSTLLALLLLLLTAPVAGLPLLLGFAGSMIVSATTAAIIVVGAVAVLIFRLGPGGRIRTDLLLFTLAVAFILCILGGEGRFVTATDDWVVRDALINDLVRQPWPFDYRIDGSAFELRAPLAMYMLPAAVGKIFSVYAAHLAMLAQNSVIFALIFYFLVPRRLTFAQAAAMVVIFAIFSGLDVVAETIKYLSTGAWPPEELERWTGLFQYSSHITQIFWVPHHAVGGWSFVCLFLLWQRGSLRSSSLAVAYLYLAFWSAIAVMGALPFLLYAAITDLRAGKIDRFDILVAPLAALPTPLLWLYLLQGSGGVEHGFMVSVPHFWNNYFSFILIEFLLYVWLIVRLRPGMMRDPVFLIVVISLLLIPFYKIGESDDFAMRASIPALALLAVTFGVLLVENTTKANQRVWASIATAVLLIGSITGAMEIRHALAKPPPISRCNVVEAWKRQELYWFSMSIYLVKTSDLPTWMRPQASTDVPASTAEDCPAPTRNVRD